MNMVYISSIYIFLNLFFQFYLYLHQFVSSVTKRISLSIYLHPRTLFLAREKSAVGRNVLLVEHTQGGLPDISGTQTLLMGLSFSSQLSKSAGRARKHWVTNPYKALPRPSQKLHYLRWNSLWGPCTSQGFDPRHLREAPTHVGAPEISSRREEVPLFFSAQQETETLINTSLPKLIKGKVFVFSSQA